MTCSRCDDLGWVQVPDAYVDRHAQRRALPEQADAFARAEAHEHHQRQRRFLSESYLPCRDCNEATFDRWASGHYAKGHEHDDCDECAGLRKNKRRRNNNAGSSGVREEF